MGFKCGVVGLPNVGKSTLFDALIKAGIKTANFPFCTIEPSTDVVPMPDPRLDQLTGIVRPQRTLPMTMEFVDVAGLVKDASKDKGLGNQLLTNVHETEAIGHVVRCFESNSITHVPGRVSSVDDIEVINTELALADPDACERAIHRAQKKAKGGDKGAKAELAALEKCLSQSENAGILHVLGLNVGEKAVIRYPSFLTLKPTIYITNVNEDGFENNPYLDQIREIIAKEGPAMVPACAAIEADIAEPDDEERGEFMQELGLKESDLNRVIRAGYKLLDLQTYFAAGVKGVCAWTILVGATAPQTADKIRADSEKGFIHAQTISFGDFITHEDGQGVKKAGKVRAEGKDYIVKDDDVMDFLFSI